MWQSIMRPRYQCDPVFSCLLTADSLSEPSFCEKEKAAAVELLLLASN